MNHFWARISSVFFLLVFLYPVVEKSVHELSHEDHVHCNSFSQYHWHEQEHHCGICEFTPPAALLPVTLPDNVQISTVFSWIVTPVEHPDTGPSCLLFLLRAPPVA